MTSTFALLGADDLLQSGINVSQDIANTWDSTWLDIFQSSLFVAIVNLSLTLAVGALLFFMAVYVREMVLDGNWMAPNTRLVWVFLCVAMLANNGRAVAVSATAMRGLIHDLSQDVLQTTFLEVNLQDAIQSAVLQGAFVSEVSAQISQCQGMVGEKQVQCLEQANAQIEESANLLEPFMTAINMQPFVRGVRGAIASARGSGPAGAIVFGAGGFLGGYLGTVTQMIVQSTLMAFQWAFANCLEIALLLTGLFGPIAVAGSLLYEGKTLFAWMTGFFSIGLAQVSYNIITGLAAVVIVKSSAPDTNGFLVIVGLLAPALALALAAGGGMAVFQVVSSGSASLLMTLSSTYSYERRYGSKH